MKIKQFRATQTHILSIIGKLLTLLWKITQTLATIVFTKIFSVYLRTKIHATYSPIILTQGSRE